MANARTLWINRITGKRLVNMRSNLNEEPARLPFYKYSTVPLKIYILDQDPDGGPNNFKKLSITGLSLTVTINDTMDDASPMVETAGASWTADAQDNSFTGVLNINTSALNSWLNSTDGKAAYLQVKYTDADNNLVTVLREQCIVYQSLDQVATTSPNPAKRYLTYDESVGLFMARELSAGECITFKSPDGTKLRTLGVTDEGTAIDDFVI